MKTKKQAKDKKVGKVGKGGEQAEEKSRVEEKPSPSGSSATQGAVKGTPLKTDGREGRPTASSAGAVTPRVEGKLAGRTSGEKSVVPVKPEEKPPARKEAATAKAPAAASTGPAIPPPAAKREEAEPPGIKKEYVQSRGLCKVTFRLPAAATRAAKKVNVVGDFNGWNREATSLRKQENGDFSVTLDLDAGREYRFRYLIDGQRWENDWRADKYVKSPYGVDDSVVSV